MPSEFSTQLQALYDQLDQLIKAEEKEKSAKDYAAWAANVNTTLLQPIAELLSKKNAEIKIQLLDANPKVKKDDHLKKLKANRYNIYTYQRKLYLEEAGDL